MRPAQRVASLIPFLLFLISTITGSVAHADTEWADWSIDAEQTLASIKATEPVLPATHAELERLNLAQGRSDTLLKKAEQCVLESEQQLASIAEKLSALGETGDNGAATDIIETRRLLSSEQQILEGQLARCRLLALDARDLKTELVEQQRDIASRQMMNREPGILHAFRDVAVNGMSFDSIRQMKFEPWPALGIGILLLAILMPTAFAMLQVLQRHFPLPGPNEATALMRRTVLLAMYKRRTPWLIGLAVATATLFAGGTSAAGAIVVALLLSVALAPLLQLLICGGRLRCPAGVPARLLMDILLVAGALFLIDASQYLPHNGFVLLRGLFYLALAVTALWLMRRLSQRTHLETLRNLQLPISAALLAGPISDWLGYHNLGAFLILGIYGTAAGLLIVSLTLSGLGRLADALRDNEATNARGLRRWMGYGPGETVRGVGALRWLLVFGTLIALGYWLMFVWQVSESDRDVLLESIGEGFRIGAVQIVPGKLIGAITAFILLLTIARWLRRQLDERWLARTSLDSGARQSIVALTSYSIIGIGIMLALSIAGLNFQNLAIVAGALSVGIGFGLQNIVNNFVSGLILLFERPVRPGDWVVVGNTEGYVRKISIRYTLIQTFDRADVLVPNSELIANQVTNLMLSDAFGRVTVPVGVAYGTDTREVRDILNQVAREHPMAVLHDPRVSPPRVLFIRFGDNSLDFELRLFIRDIDYKLSVRSDLLFAIDDAFREAGIEIPFPQRVVHMPEERPPQADDE